MGARRHRPALREPYVDIDEWRDAPVRTATSTAASRAPIPGSRSTSPGAVPGPVLPAHHADARQREPRPGCPRRGQQDRLLDRPAAPISSRRTAAAGSANPGSALDPTITAYRANAAAAALLAGRRRRDVRRQAALRLRLRRQRRRLPDDRLDAENTAGVWDGVVPYVPGRPMAIPNMFTVRMQALRVLRDKFPSIVDAETGRQRRPFAALTPRSVTPSRGHPMGFPPKSWFGYQTMGLHGFPALYGGVCPWPDLLHRLLDRARLPRGRPSRIVRRDRIQLASTVAELIGRGGRPVGSRPRPQAAATSRPAHGVAAGQASSGSGSPSARRVDPRRRPDRDLGRAAGERHPGSPASTATSPSSSPASRARSSRAGDAVEVDNSNFLAAETYHRHQVPGRTSPSGTSSASRRHADATAAADAPRAAVCRWRRRARSRPGGSRAR